MSTERLAKVLMFAWKRWTMAERALTHAGSYRNSRARRAKKACEFWRTVHRVAETALDKAVAPNRLAHAAVSREDADAHFTRPVDTDLPESFPDLPVVNCGAMLRTNGGRRE